jgi:hypothetical protein
MFIYPILFYLLRLHGRSTRNKIILGTMDESKLKIAKVCPPNGLLVHPCENEKLIGPVG